MTRAFRNTATTPPTPNSATPATMLATARAQPHPRARITRRALGRAPVGSTASLKPAKSSHTPTAHTYAVAQSGGATAAYVAPLTLRCSQKESRSDRPDFPHAHSRTPPAKAAGARSVIQPSARRASKAPPLPVEAPAIPPQAAA